MATLTFFRSAIVSPASSRPDGCDHVKDNPRLQAVRALVKVIGQDKTLDQVLSTDTPPLVRELTSGTLRHYFSLSQRVDELLTRKLRDKDLDVRCLLLVGAYQLIHTRIPDHAAVAETVSCTKTLKKPWAKGLVNAVLRNLPEPTEEWSPAALNDHPHWFLNLLRNSLSEHWVDILSANNTRAPMTLRVNCARTSVADYQALLDQNDIGWQQGALPETLFLDLPRPQTKLPGFEEGLVAVQDGAAQLAVTAAGAKPGMRVLDACAAPGGKGFHLLEQEPEVFVRMQDVAPARVTTVIEQAKRLGHVDPDTVQIKVSDSTDTEAGPDERYDLILLDAPCSGSGTVRRHPDIKVLRAEKDLEVLNNTQNALLDALWQRITPGGRLIYSTCSLFQEENDEIISAFIERCATNATHPTKVEVGFMASRFPIHNRTPFVTTRHGIQTLPTVDGSDGLYYAELIAPTDKT